MNICWDIEYFDHLPSTQDHVLSSLRDDPDQLNAGQVIVAKSQSTGHGRHGRVWSSPEGNLYFSFLLKPEIDSQKIGQLGLVVAVALGHTIRDLLLSPRDMMLKWPNDILLDGKKCAGILIDTALDTEGQVEHAVVGIGLNTSAAPDDVVSTSICDYAACRSVPTCPDNEAVLDMFLSHMNKAWLLWQNGDFDQIMREWLSMAHPVDAPISVKLGDLIIKGTFSGVDISGALLLQDDETGEQRMITAGEVYLNRYNDPSVTG